jgi:glycerol uptake facilitator-like aquaporin
VGTALLLCAVVGSGIMGERLAGGNVAIALLANTLATGAALVALILAFGPISGAHFNPLVTAGAIWDGRVGRTEAAQYVLAQVSGAVIGVVLAHAMFGEPLLQAATHRRTGSAQWLSETIATFGLVVVIELCRRARTDQVAYAVGLYIASAYWFTASTSFANPAVTVARALTNSFAGIRPLDTIGFVCAQVVGCALALVMSRRWLAGDVQTAGRAS